MARNSTIKFLRTSRTNLNAQASANGLIIGEPYFITGENRIAIAYATNTYVSVALDDEVAHLTGGVDFEGDITIDGTLETIGSIETQASLTALDFYATNSLTVGSDVIFGAEPLTTFGKEWITETGATSTNAARRTALGLGNVDNTSDADKPLSDAVVTEFSLTTSYIDSVAQDLDDHVTSLTTLINGVDDRIDTEILGVFNLPNGIAALDAGGKLDESVIPSSVLGSLKYKGTWDADTNSPDIDAAPTMGDYYLVSAAGSTNLDGESDWRIKDWAVYNGTSWAKIDNTETVTSVNGSTGAVSITTSSIGAVPTGATTTSGRTMATARILGRTTASTGAIEELTEAQLATFLGLVKGVNFSFSGVTTETDGTGDPVGIAIAPYNFTIVEGNGVWKAGVAATGSTVLTVKKNGTSIGTITFSASGTTGTLDITGSTSVSTGDVILIQGPDTPDATLADIVGNIRN